MCLTTESTTGKATQSTPSPRADKSNTAMAAGKISGSSSISSLTPTKRQHQQKKQASVWLYLLCKSVAGWAYYGLLDSVGLTTPGSRFWTFQVLTPLVKLYHMRSRGIYDHSLFLFSVAHDCIMSALFFGVVVSLRGLWYAGMTGVIFPVALLLEWLAFRYFLSESPVYIPAASWADLSVLPAGLIMFAAFGCSADFATRPLRTDFVAFVAVLLWTDAQFGVTHYLAHKLPWMWARHKDHHRYGRAELNLWAGIHADVLDNLQMNGSLLVPMLALGPVFRASPLVITEWMYLIPFTHARFQLYHINCMAFFEFDLVDMLLGQPRLGDYHAVHHEVVGRNFSIFGLLTDSTVKSLGGLFVR